MEVLTRIEGRLQELVVTGDGRYISMTALNMHNDLFNHVRQFQFAQREVGRLELRLAPESQFHFRRRERIRGEIQAKLGTAMALEVAVVEEIHRTPAGKLRFLEQHLPIRFDGGPVDDDHGDRS